MAEVAMKEVFLGIGSNLGNREENLNNALIRISMEVGRILDSSSVYETEPWGFDTDNQFLNMVVKVETRSDPMTLLKALLKIEKYLGRSRDKGIYSSRVIDIDILFYGDLIFADTYLKIPHPHIHERRFVLVPLAEIAPDFIHPLFNRTVSYLLDNCTDTGLVNKLNS